MKDRSGPLDRDASFTTITIVNSSIIVIPISKYELLEENIDMIW